MHNYKDQPECHLWGERFSPALLQGIPDIVIRLANEPDEIAKSGPRKGATYNYGSCCLEAPDSLGEHGSRIEWMADFIASHKDEFEAAGATDIVFWIYWTGNQGNTELSVKELKKIASLDIPLAMDYIFLENND